MSTLYFRFIFEEGASLVLLYGDQVKTVEKSLIKVYEKGPVKLFQKIDTQDHLHKMKTGKGTNAWFVIKLWGAYFPLSWNTTKSKRYIAFVGCKDLDICKVYEAFISVFQLVYCFPTDKHS